MWIQYWVIFQVSRIVRSEVTKSTNTWGFKWNSLCLILPTCLHYRLWLGIHSDINHVPILAILALDISSSARGFLVQISHLKILPKWLHH